MSTGKGTEEQKAEFQVAFKTAVGCQGHRNPQLCKTLKTTTEQFGPFFTEQFRKCELNPEHVAATGAACA